MRLKLTFGLLVIALLTTGCFHQIVRTGASPGSTVIERPWTATYIFGLVAAQPIMTASECPRGVAIVETQQSFLNGLVGALTLGIYTPQTVTITCAGGGADDADLEEVTVAAAATAAERAVATRRAVDLARQTGEPVILRFEQ